MPLYEYECLACGIRFEALVRKGDEPSCPSCRSVKLERVLSLFAVTTESTSRLAFDRARQAHRKSTKEQEFYQHDDHDDHH